VTFPHNQMQMLGYNRVVRDLNGMTAEQFLERLAGVADITEAPADHQPRSRREVTFYLDGKWHLLTWKESVTTNPDPVERLDVAILQAQVLTPMLAIGNPRTDKRISFVGGIRGMREL